MPSWHPIREGALCGIFDDCYPAAISLVASGDERVGH